MGYFIPIWILGAPFVIGVILWMRAPKADAGLPAYAGGRAGTTGTMATPVLR